MRLFAQHSSKRFVIFYPKQTMQSDEVQSRLPTFLRVKPITLQYGQPTIQCSIDDTTGKSRCRTFVNRFISPHPLTTYTYTHPLPKTLFWFLALIIPLFTYIGMDSLLVENGKYSDIEYANHADVLQAIMNRMGPQAFITFGFSCALHLVNAVSYSIFLTLSACWCRWKLALLGFPRIAVFYDVIAWLQVLLCSFYYIQHITLLVMFMKVTATEALTNLVMACSIIFLVILCTTVFFLILAWLVINIMQLVLRHKLIKQDKHMSAFPNQTGIGGIGALPLAAKHQETPRIDNNV